MKEGNCHKIVIGLLLCGLFICFGFYMKGCGDSGEKGKLLFSPASMEFSEPEVKEVLDAEEIAGLSVDYKEGVKASDIVEGINGTKEIQKELFLFIRNTLQEEDPTGAQFDNYFGNESGCYLSKVSLRSWDVAEYKMSDFGSDFAIFSRDLKKTAVVTVMLDGKEITGMSFSQDGTLVEMLREHPDEKYIYLCGAGRARLLDKNNALYMDDSEVQVKGDYYHALDYKEIGLSYKDITDKKNLVWIQAED